MYRNSEFTLEYYPMLLIRIGSIAVCEWGLKASETIQLKVKLFTISHLKSHEPIFHPNLR